jgi:hypothetical protein
MIVLVSSTLNIKSLSGCQTVPNKDKFFAQPRKVLYVCLTLGAGYKIS